jgi:hypothetical protein
MVELISLNNFFLERPNLFYLQSVIIHSANGGKGEGSHVLSSTPLLVKVRKSVETAGNRNLQTRTYKQEILVQLI